MNLAPKPDYQNNRTSRARKRSSLKSDRQVTQLPTQQPPQWLSYLLLLQRGSSIFALSLIGLTLAIYAQTIYFPQLWTKEYKKLKTLQSNEREFIATNETLKNQLAKQAEKPETGFVNPLPTNAIFLPVPQETLVLSSKEKETENKINNLTQTTLGY